MKDGGCTKHYPKTSHDSTSMDGDGYPFYCKSNDIGHMVMKHVVIWLIIEMLYLIIQFYFGNMVVTSI